ncbi:MAG TPA: hypothetical protein VGH74_07080 [Planctomycetaceae bacterium]|jgi:hypothetical protein
MIRFSCSCGRSLNAPEKLAGKKSRCPSCAAAVVVPQLAMVFAGFELRDESPLEEPPAARGPRTWLPCSQEPGDPNYVPTILRTRGSGARPDPLSGVKFVVSLSAMQAVLTALGMALYPHVLHEGLSWFGGLVLAVVWVGGMGILIGYGCNYLDSVLEYAVSGGERLIYVPNRDPVPAIASFLKWAFCFVLGPAVFIFLAANYWIHCGDATLVDGMILAELTTPAIGYWTLALLVLAERPQLAFASPSHVLQAIGRLGRRALVATLGMTAAAFVYVCVGAYAVMLLHNACLLGLILLWLCWYSAWECGAFALRIVGFWYHDSARASAHDCDEARRAQTFSPP